MQRTVCLVPCSDFLAAGEQPTVMYVRSRDRPKDGGGLFHAAKVGYRDVWYVATKTIDVVNPDKASYVELEQPEMALARYEDQIRIPLFRYFTNARDLRLLHGYAAQIGAAARDALPKVKRVLQMHLAIGDVFDRPEQNQLEFYLGVAFRCMPNRE